VAKTYFIWTVGCQMNEADSEKLARELEGRGLTAAGRMENADYIVLNTCSVRAAAEEKTYGKLGELKALKRRRPEITIAVGGCMVGADHSELAKRAPHVDEFFRPIQFDQFLRRVENVPPAAPVPIALNLAPELKPTPFTAALGEGCVEEPTEAPGSLARPNRPTRWVSIINGCNRACTYCIVPQRRGREISRPVEELVAEVRGLVADGAREVTLLGQIVDRYGRDLPGRPDLADLWAALGNVDGLWRIRFLTSHPADMTDRIVDAIAANPKVCEHVNIPVQSGSDSMLSRMKRGYRTDRYLELIDKLRARIPGVALATDLIVGMCGETDDEFQATLDLLERVRFDVVHVAMYSPRPGTRAAEWEDDVPHAVKRERLHAVERVQERIGGEINGALLGETLEVLVEAQRKGRWEGRTRTNKLVFFDDAENWLGRLAQVRINKASAWSLQGEVVGESPLSLYERRGLPLPVGAA
jgi:tRNA-2-methylthio-N6-dimethylallyladenosine synthase